MDLDALTEAICLESLSFCDPARGQDDRLALAVRRTADGGSPTRRESQC
jgi:hypothetical protein